jgi:diaminohydroxyphosphoribosylaminopyrimidine deaminase / 5-amino-6-(5-phosphoribosylamino)uracil reductase
VPVVRTESREHDMTRPLRGAVPHDPADDLDPAAPATGVTLVGAMHRALAASVAVHGATSPNPPVGAVVLDAAGVVVGVGATAPPGGPHAEVTALREAGPRARGGTVVVTLEPCAHHGRTPPCTQALAAAGVATVVFAVRDPHPTAGGGADVLRAGGVAVREGVLGDEVARGPLRAWLHAVCTGRPHVTWKLAATLDGRSAAADGTSRWITGADARAEVHALRAGMDAIVVGTGTVLADDPSLTARRADGSLRERSPLRVVVGHRDVPSGYALDVPDVLHLRTHDPDAVLAALHDRGVVDVLLEGGPRLAGAFVAAHRVDRVLAYLAPALLGAGPAALDAAGVGTIADIARLQVDEVRRVGVDVLVDARPERTLNGVGPARAGSAAPGTDGSPLHEETLHEGTLRKGAV